MCTDKWNKLKALMAFHLRTFVTGKMKNSCTKSQYAQELKLEIEENPEKWVQF